MRFNLRYKTLDEHSVIMSKGGLENQLEKKCGGNNVSNHTDLKG